MDTKPPLNRRFIQRMGIALVVLIVLGYTVYAQAALTIRAQVRVGGIRVGGLTRERAAEAVSKSLGNSQDEAVTLVVEGKKYPIPAADIRLRYDIAGAVEKAWGVGRTGNPLLRIGQLAMLPLFPRSLPVNTTLDEALLRNEIANIKHAVDEPGKDIRLKVSEGVVTILTDTKLGFILDESEAMQAVIDAIAEKKNETRPLTLTDVQPSVAYENAPKAKEEAERVITHPLTMTDAERRFTISTERLGGWLQSIPQGPQLQIAFNDALVSEYITTIAKELNAESQAPKVIVSNGRVVEFLEPRTGRSLDQDQTVSLIKDALQKRADNVTEITELALPVKVENPVVTDQSAQELGIVELIGSASTRFTGSPPNRISNIKNGVKFLTGILIKPGEEFSTLKTLGKIDNTTGYLPELVIKENRTVPEFGGGLCQVSTTLFRAVLATGLPITSRQNHSYRVSYYEKDGDGISIGPGLDATIYNPAPDFRFINDTGVAILIQGHVEGDTITFDFYGTKDGRVATVDGPHTLSSTPAGEPIYIETDTLKPGETKQIERAHAGGSAIATYSVVYPDGTKKEQVFKSLYRNWPAQFLIGADPTKATTTESMSNQ
ncbi:MAG: VanW family protein [Candidatus Komeilibacteria bacterium]|nr:VanW family protein [Candidatus Komeilibacteria bacterium]